MANDIKVFNNDEFGQIRTVLINEQTWFVGKDIAEALGYSNYRHAMKVHVDEEDKGVAKCDTLGGRQNINVINESGLYSLILSSKLSKAKKFKRWVTAEVLPSIRRTGMYATNQLVLDLAERVEKLEKDRYRPKASQVPFNNKLKYSRLAKGFTQKEMAAMVGVDISTYYRYEQGRYIPKIARALILAEILDMSMEDLFTN